MKKLTLYSIVLTIGLIIGQPLYADTIAYTFEDSFHFTDGWYDDLTFNGYGTAVVRFIVGPPSINDQSFPNAFKSDFLGNNASITLSGTYADGTYKVISPVRVNILNSLSYSTNDFDLFTMNFDFATQYRAYNFHIDVEFPISFWNDSETVPYPKVFSDVTTVNASIISQDEKNNQYYSSAVNISSQAVPVPPSILLLGSGLLGLAGWRRLRG